MTANSCLFQKLLINSFKCIGKVQLQRKFLKPEILYNHDKKKSKISCLQSLMFSPWIANGVKMKKDTIVISY